MDIDRQTGEVVQMVSEGARLTVNLINYVFRSLADALEKNGEKTLIDSKTREGKQKINDLIKKHKDGIKTLDENLTKEQVKDYQKELRKLGVDFSIVKNDRDNYSFFFAGSQAEVIEKALKNVVELKERVQNNDKVKDAQIDLNSEMKDSSEKEIENANKAYNDFLEREESGGIPEREELNENEKVLFDKIKNLDETEKEVQQKVQKEMELNETSKGLGEQKDKTLEMMGSHVSNLKQELDFLEEPLENAKEENLPELPEIEKTVNDLKGEIEKNENIIEELSNTENENEFNKILFDNKETVIDSANKTIDREHNNLELYEEFQAEDQMLASQDIDPSSFNKSIDETSKKMEMSSDNIQFANDLKDNVENLKESDLQLDDKEIELESKDETKEMLNEKLSELSNEELALFEKKMEYENSASAPISDSSKTHELADELKTMKSEHSQETIDKINNLDTDIKNLDNSTEITEGSKLNANEILKETKQHTSTRKKNLKQEKENTYSIDNVKKLDEQIKSESKDKKLDREKKAENTL